MQTQLKTELEKRIANLILTLTKINEGWDTALIVSKVNQFYFCGTMQDGILVIKKDGSYKYFVRRSFDRAKVESPLEFIYPIESYKDILPHLNTDLGNTFIETETMTIGILERFKKYFNLSSVLPIERALLTIRAVKSEYELSIIKESGIQHQKLLCEILPTLLKEGMSEAELMALIFKEAISLGYQGVSRFSMFQTDLGLGQIGFGTNSLYPTFFDGPGGMLGMSPASPIIGSRERKLKKGDLVFADIGYGVNGYHTDKTAVYSFGAKPSEEVLKIHTKLLDIQKRTAELLKVGNIPQNIYETIMNDLDTEFLENFMGFGKRRVKFLGHGVGLHIDEMPVIASGFKEPLCENMVIALEPKKGIANVGMVGAEDTYLVTKDGGICLTGGGRDILVV